MAPAAASTTVRHTPLTAILSPAANSEASADTITRRSPPGAALRSTISPMDSTRPVNISLNHDVRPKCLDNPLRQPCARRCVSAQKLDAPGAEHVRRDVETHEIDEAFVPRCRVKSCSTFEQEGPDTARTQTGERLAERTVPRDLNLGAGRLEARACRRAGRPRWIRHDDDRAGGPCREHPRRVRRSEAPVEDDAH